MKCKVWNFRVWGVWLWLDRKIERWIDRYLCCGKRVGNVGMEIWNVLMRKVGGGGLRERERERLERVVSNWDLY